MKFYVCGQCGNIIEYVKESGVPVMCCGSKMKELVPGTSDGAAEKHVPAVTVEQNRVLVQIGSVEHPMTEEHHIEWIVMETEKGCQKVKLTPEDQPKAEFLLTEGDKLRNVYEYCNLHGLWKKDMCEQ
ncbi:MAG: desulfoferrodoxin [Lachnospiraceae bacterium]|nr:desulfoferrodoxin [Lachnospiraceae bacterium]